MRLREEPCWDCVLACLCHAYQTLSFDHVFDMELDCKLNFAGTEPIAGHTRKRDTECERKRKRERDCVLSVTIYRCCVSLNRLDAEPCACCVAE